MNALKTLGWGLYLACSWTWCIGLFLPVVLLQRYGWAGFVVFAIPNLIGCVAFAYIVRTPERSKKLVAEYGRVMSLFSIVTIAFHVFFISMMAKLHWSDQLVGVSIWAPLLVLGLAACVGQLSSRLWLVLAAVVWLVSLLAGFSLLPLEAAMPASQPWQEALWLLPITLFGFLLCPYLDLTFHRALQSAPSKHAFAVFGVTFAAMIGITCLYQPIIFEWLPVLLAVHIGLQIVFTIGAHGQETWRLWDWPRLPFTAVIAVVCIVAMGVAHWPHEAIQGQIDNYLRFFVFYGLVFPGFIVSFIIAGQPVTSARMKIFIALLLLSTPFLELGYIGGNTSLTVLPVILFMAWLYRSNQQ